MWRMGSAKKLTPHEDQRFSAGTVLMREGEESGDLWILREGQVEVFRERGGHRHVLAKLGPGEMLGTMTATTGSARSASAVALTEVKVTIVSREQVQKLIKDLPTWAHSFIKDLVARVNYANELYIDHELAHAAEAASPFELVLKVIRVWPSLAEAAAKEKGGVRGVSFKASVDSLTQVFGDERQLRNLLELFCAHGLLTPTDAGDFRHLPLEGIHELTLLAGLVEAVRKTQVEGQPFTLPLAQGERKSLAAIADLGSGGTGDKAIMALQDVEDALRKKGIELDVEALTRARRLGLLELDKAAKPPSLTFDPRWIRLGLETFQLLKELVTGGKDDASQPKEKKTLLY